MWWTGSLGLGVVFTSVEEKEKPRQILFTQDDNTTGAKRYKRQKIVELLAVRKSTRKDLVRACYV